jgi:hypothetical protein
MPITPSRRSTAGAGLLAVALALLSLGAPWLASAIDCRAPGCDYPAGPEFLPASIAAPGPAACPCPTSCEPAPTRGCTQACGPVRETIGGRQPNRVRPVTAELASVMPPSVERTMIAAADRPRRHFAAPPPHASAPLFIRHQSILR